MNILLATIIGLSFSVRTPNVTPNPLDYELAAKISKEQGKFTYFVKRDWERELGVEYIDTEFEISEKLNPLYIGVKYIDKQSKDYKYGQARIGLATDIAQGGLAVTEDGNTMANVRLYKVVKGTPKPEHPVYKSIEYKIDFDLSTDLVVHIWEITSELRIYFSKNIHVFALMDKEMYNAKKDEQYKVGLGVKF